VTVSGALPLNNFTILLQYTSSGGLLVGRYGIDWSKGLENFTDEDYGKIMEETTKIIENNEPDELLSGAYYDRGSIYIDRGNYEMAIFDFTSALQLHFNHPDAAHYNRGLAYYMLKKLDLALSDFNEANYLHPEDKNTLHMIELTTSKNR
jgi:tetratricopeptide (TPR) repeat protein